MAAYQYVYTMSKMSRAYGQKVILDNITLAFLPGANVIVNPPLGFVILEHFSYCCRALNGSRNQAFASSAVSKGSFCAMA